MYCTRNVTDRILWIGGNDRRLALFENVYPIPRGVSYNAYFIDDEKTAVLDTVDHAVSGQFFENLAHCLRGRRLDYLIVNHMEPDHAATIQDLVLRYPEVRVVCNKKTADMIRQFFTFDLEGCLMLVKEGDSLSTGSLNFTFVMAPMVHWPEVMMTYETTGRILFSADAFGTFGALNGHLFADEVNFDRDYMDEARRYYTNIVGKYGTQVQAVLKKAASIPISMICPLHGFVWRQNLSRFIEKYLLWSTYTPEEEGVLIACGSIYGNTENAAEILAGKLAERGVKVQMYDVSVTHSSYLIAEAFRFSHIVFASATYNAGVFVNMENLLHDMVNHNLQGRTVAFLENGTWAPMAAGAMSKILAPCKNMRYLDTKLTLRSSMKESQESQMDALVQEILDSMPKAPASESDGRAVEQKAMFRLSYGLFLMTARDGEKDNGCVVNTVMQLTDQPMRILVSVNKQNLTHDMIARTGVLNVSVLTEDAPFELFQHYGFQSGRDVDKFAGTELPRSENGLVYLSQFTNAFLSGKVVSQTDLGTHTLFVAEVTEAKALSDRPSVTYAYYFDHIKPKPQPLPENKKGFVCKVCGYVYEGETLPEDFICPLCKHGAADFEPLK